MAARAFVCRPIVRGVPRKAKFLKSGSQSRGSVVSDLSDECIVLSQEPFLTFLVFEGDAARFEEVNPKHLLDECRDLAGRAFQDDKVGFFPCVKYLTDSFCAVRVVGVFWIPVLFVVSESDVGGLTNVEGAMVTRVNEHVNGVVRWCHVPIVACLTREAMFL